MTTNDLILPYPYQIIELPPFDLLGFTKIVSSGGEQYLEVRKDGRWEGLRQMAGIDKTIFGIASMDKDCPKDYYRYTLAVKNTADFHKNIEYENQLFPFRVKSSTWVVFTLEHFTEQYGSFWARNPYTLIQQLGYDYNRALGIHLDVYPEAYQTDDDEMAFWMPIKVKKS